MSDSTDDVDWADVGIFYGRRDWETCDQDPPYDTWTTKSGQVLKIAEMGTDHIKNTLAFIERKGLGVHPTRHALLYFELRLRESKEKTI